MAYVALVSLARVLEQILYHDQASFSLHDRQHIISLRGNINFLLAFLEDFPREASKWEGRITNAANRAEYVIQQLYLHKIRSEYTCCDVISCFNEVILSLKTAIIWGNKVGGPARDKSYNWQRLYIELHRMIEEITSIVGEATQTKRSGTSKNLTLSRSFGSTSSRIDSNTIGDDLVGYDGDLMEKKARLSRWRSI